MQKAVCALSGVVVLCLAAIVCLFVVMHHNAKIVSSHHDVPPLNPDTHGNLSTKPQRSRTVTPRQTYGPDDAKTDAPPIDLFRTMGCDITTFPGLSSNDVRVQYSRANKRLDCKYTVDLSAEEYFLRTNGNHFNIEITPAAGSMLSQQCTSRTSPCGPSNNVYIIGNANPNQTLAIAKATRNNTPTKQLQGNKQRYSYLLVSGINKIQARVRLLPGHVACQECCHVSKGTFLDVHYFFTFTCPDSYNDISDYKIGSNT